MSKTVSNTQYCMLLTIGRLSFPRNIDSGPDRVSPNKSGIFHRRGCDIFILRRVQDVGRHASSRTRRALTMELNSEQLASPQHVRGIQSSQPTMSPSSSIGSSVQAVVVATIGRRAAIEMATALWCPHDILDEINPPDSVSGPQ